MSKHKFIDDKEALKSLKIEDVMLATGLWEKRGSRLFHLEHKKNMKPKTNVFKNNTCTCSDCGFHANNSIDVALHYKETFFSAIEWLKTTFNVSKIPNPDYVPLASEKREWDKILTKVKSVTSYDKNTTQPMTKKSYSISYQNFDSKRVRKADTKKGEDLYLSLPYKDRLMLIYTFIYHFSMQQDRQDLKNYLQAREVSVNHNEIKTLGYIPVVKFSELLNILKKKYPISDLIEMNVINDEEHTKPLSFKLHYIEEGGVILYPSFHKYNYNLVTGFMFRATKPKQWMIDAHMKEIQMSCNEIYETLPYGFTSSFIMDEDAIKCVVEGGPDAHCCPEEINGKKLLFISLPGVNGMKENQLGLLKGQTLRLMLDPDLAGQIGMYGSITIKKDLIEEFKFTRSKEGLLEYKKTKELLESSKTSFYEVKTDGIVHKCHRAGVKVEVCSWDERWGDLNDVRKKIQSGIAPFSDMKEFLLKHTVVKKIKSV